MLVLVLLTGCSDKVPVKVERDPLADFSRFATYAWLPAGRGEDMFDLPVRNAIELQLAGRGYAPAADPEQADLLVAARTVVEEDNADTFGEYLRYRESGGTEPLSNAFAIGYEQAKLTVEVIARETGQPVWRGVGVVAMDARQRAQRAAATVAHMFEQFPRR